ncbi:MAG: hypothetical protein ACJ765_14630 [Chloroflexota bacterium]
MRPSRPIPAFVAVGVVAAVLSLGGCSPSAAAATAATSAAGASAAAASPDATKASTGPAPAASPSPTAIAAARCDKVAKPFDAKTINLTGAWAGDDGGIYYLRQLGSVLWWNGMSERARPPASLGRDWNNVARGEIKALAVDVEWADVPRGGILGGGTMKLNIQDDGTGNVRIAKITETGSGFGNTVWTPCKPG